MLGTFVPSPLTTNYWLVPKTVYQLGSPEFLASLKAALERMVSQVPENRPFVVVEDTVTKRFVQFAGDFKKPITVDVPWRANMSPKNQNVMNTSMAVILLGDPTPLNEFGVCFFQRKCRGVSEAAEVARYVLRDVLELPDIATLTIGESGNSKTFVS